MEIPPDTRPVDRTLRKRGESSIVAPRTPVPAGGAAAPSAGSAAPADRASFGDAAAISRYVDRLKTMNPTNLHRVEELRSRIADGTYTADPEELADLLLGGQPRPGEIPGRPPSPGFPGTRPT